MTHVLNRLADLIDPAAVPTRLADGFEFTEGPTWDAKSRSLCFNDIPDDSRWRWSAEQGVELVNRPNYKGNGQAFDGEGNLLVCEHLSSAVVRIGRDGTRETLAFQYRSHYLNSPNDLAVRAADGSIYFTDPTYGRGDDRTGLKRPLDLGFQGLFRVPRNGGDLELMLDEDEFLNPNGLCFSPAQDFLYVNDTDRGDIKAWTVRADGSLIDRRVLYEGALPGATGWLDGVECDERGNLWVSAPGGICVLTRDGELLGVISTPEPLGSLVWGGDEFRSLFLASSKSLHVLKTLVRGASLPGDRAGG